MRLTSAAVVLCATTALSGCLGGGSGADVTRSAPGAALDGLAPRAPVLAAATDDAPASAVIGDLMARQSVLGAGALAQVADAVLAANSRAAEAELRAALLRSEARSQNWLPRLGPAVNLTSLGSVITSLVLNQAILDNGARAAERDFARADVEVAAVALAQDSNQRVHEALGLYLAAQKALAQARVLDAAQADLSRYVWMMEERVAAGVSDRADLSVVQQRRDELMADLAADRESAAVAMAELQAMAAIPVGALTGLSPVAEPPPATRALTVLRAEAEGARALAEARVTRAGYLPGLSLGGDLGGGGLGLSVNAPNGIGLGQGSAMEAAMAEAAAVEARVGSEDEAAAREIAALRGRLDSLIRQRAEAGGISDRAAANYALFAEQRDAGQRSVGDVMGVLETRLRTARTVVGLDHDIVATRIAIAARLGALVQGERM